MRTEQHGRRLRLGAGALAVLLILAGALILTVGLRAQRHAPQPPASAAIPYAADTATTSTTTVRPPALAARGIRGPVLPASTPTHLDIPAIGVSSALMELGLNADHTVQVPPLGRDSRAGWYRYSPSPGQVGPAVLLGHVDSAQYGPGVFFELGATRPGELVSVTRADHTVAVFRVDRVVSYSKNAFPTLEVYGNTDHAALRLITCGGRFDLTSHSYENNIVVYASLVSSHRA
jgi:sortase (surface protein transpeptidase)